MKVEIANWNIGAGLVTSIEGDPRDPKSYTVPALDQVIDELRTHKPGPPAIITLQGVESSAKFNQAKQIADALNYNVRHQALGTSPFTEGADIGIAILSQFELWSAEFFDFGNDEGMLRVKSPISPFKHRLMIACANFSSMSYQTIQALKLNPTIYSLYLLQGELKLGSDDDLKQVPMPHQTLSTNHNTDQSFYRGIKLVPSPHLEHRPTLSQTGTWSKLVINEFEFPEDPPLRPQTRVSARPILLHGDHPWPNTPRQNSSAQ